MEKCGNPSSSSKVGTPEPNTTPAHENGLTTVKGHNNNNIPNVLKKQFKFP
jgi:hypothetical protein